VPEERVNSGWLMRIPQIIPTNNKEKFRHGEKIRLCVLDVERRGLRTHICRSMYNEG
jgi:hypothetical protein